MASLRRERMPGCREGGGEDAHLGEHAWGCVQPDSVHECAHATSTLHHKQRLLLQPTALALHLCCSGAREEARDLVGTLDDTEGKGCCSDVKDECFKGSEARLVPSFSTLLLALTAFPLSSRE